MKQKETHRRQCQRKRELSFLKENHGITEPKELQDDLTTKYGKKGGFETPEEAEKSYWEYEKDTRRSREISRLQKCKRQM